MTQSGQGEDPQISAVPPAHEGVVLPADGSGSWGPAAPSTPPGGQAWGQSWGPSPMPPQAQPGGQGYAGQPAQSAYPGQQPYPGQGWPEPAQAGNAPAAQPLPPEVPAGGPVDQGATQYIPPVAGGALPPEAVGGTDSEATQYMAHPSAPAAGAPAHPFPAAGDAQATQYLPPVGAAGPGNAEATQYLPPVGAAGPGNAEATQYLPPVGAQEAAYGERQPPSEFDSLFRNEGRPQQPQQPPPPPYEPLRPRGRRAEPEPERAGPARKPAHAVLISAVVVGCAVVGLLAGALMSGGDEDKNGTQPVAATNAPEAEQKSATQPAEDPAKAQAEELDKLLEDSNNSRASVISAVQSIKACDNLDDAAGDLRDAARQRRDLVNRLKDISVDKLPDHAALTADLTKAWQASASADDHYAEWAHQVDGKKGCKDGKARNTQSAAEGNRASGEATAAKQSAANRWNAIAEKYGLKKRTATDL
ncbi:hypothetical protein GCM10020367_28440 [Streptomyces sannanensis]|uniref:Uncharacterized protein n=1 Tax=Streptomyces sannanensis TaxID=285536 RepID=A0ABP6SB68_9ACTN